MEIQITTRTLKEVIKKLGDRDHIVGIAAWRFSNRKPSDLCNLSLDQFTLAELQLLQECMKSNDEESTRRVSKLVNSLKDPVNKPVTSLRDFPRIFQEYLESEGRPLLHSMDAELRGVAYRPVDCKFTDRRDRYEAHVTLGFGYNTKMEYKVYTITLYARDMNCTVPELLRKYDLMVPDESMSEEYVKIIAKFETYGALDGEQFWLRGTAPCFRADEDDDDYFWWRNETVDLMYSGNPSKGVLDLAVTDRRHDRRRFYSTVPVSIFGDDKSGTVPTHPVLPLFSLSRHKMVWVNVVNMKKYKYESDLRNRLVLPTSHSNLIGALVSNLEAMKLEDLSEDKSRTIRAKASSSIILARGPAGTGKTLTAEVYAEEIQRPLYEVQTGQLGTTSEEIEKNLKRILARSTRLRMPLLINEADVFIRSRGNDLQQTAIVAVFLRLLEYHNGLVFLTTNRDDIDDAILSRCIAVIKYDVPKASERLRLWQLLLAEFNVKLSNEELRRAVLLFPKVTGRDIQNVIRLTNRVCTALQQPFSLQALRDNAVFKDVEVLTDAQLAAEIERRKAIKETKDSS